MAYSNPKTDWTADDGIAASDLNRIEANIEANKADVVELQIERFVLQSRAGSDVSISDDYVHNSSVDIPAGASIYLENFKLYFANAASFTPTIWVNLGTAEAAYYEISPGDLTGSPDALIYTNDTGSPLSQSRLTFALYGTANMLATDSWWLQFKIVAA